MIRIFFSAHGLRAFEKMPRKIRERLIQGIESLADDPLWYRRVKKLEGSEDRYRLRIGRWRILFTAANNEMEIMDVFMRKEDTDYRRRGA